MEQPQSSIHCVAVRKPAGHVRLQENEIRSCFGLSVVLAAYTALQTGEIVFGAEVVTTSLGQWLPHTVLLSAGRGIYFANITLAFAQMIFFFSLQAKFTGGEDGIQTVPRGPMFGVLDLRQTMTMYWVVLAVFLLGFLTVYGSGQSNPSPASTVRSEVRLSTAPITALD